MAKKLTFKPMGDVLDPAFLEELSTRMKEDKASFLAGHYTVD